MLEKDRLVVGEVDDVAVEAKWRRLMSRGERRAVATGDSEEIEASNPNDADDQVSSPV